MKVRRMQLIDVVRAETLNMNSNLKSPPVRRVTFSSIRYWSGT